MRTTRERFWNFLLIANAVVIVLFWFHSSGVLVGQNLPFTLIAIGRLSGLIAVYTVLLQFFFMGRLPMLEGAFGLDRLSRIHHKNGTLSFYFLVLHPILLIFGYKISLGVSVWQQLKTFLFNTEDVIWAFIALILFVIVVASSIKISRSRLKYEYWYYIHIITYLAVFLALPHQISIGEDIIGNNLFYWYWITLYTVVFAIHLAFRFIRPVYNFYKQKFVVSRVVRENYNTVSVYIKGNHLDKFNIHPGQFMIFRFLIKGLWWQAHPFSLSKFPDSNELRITVKELGDFTDSVKNILPGTKILIDGPYGVFTNFFGISNKVLLIAGGIGITPIRSLMEEMLKGGKDVVLLYGNRKQEDIVFKNEIEELVSKYPAKVNFVLSEEESFVGEKGYIDEEKIKRLVPDFLSREIYLCGPPPMMEKVITTLTKSGVKSSKLHYERFALS